jgi:hypothetical protein
MKKNSAFKYFLLLSVFLSMVLLASQAFFTKVSADDSVVFIINSVTAQSYGDSTASARVKITIDVTASGSVSDIQSLQAQGMMSQGSDSSPITIDNIMPFDGTQKMNWQGSVLVLPTTAVRVLNFKIISYKDITGASHAYSSTTSSPVTIYPSANNMNVVCGSANNTIAAAAPTAAALCLNGTASGFITSNPWAWTCSGANGSIVNCATLPYQNVTVTGACGAAHGTTVSTISTSGLCGSGTVTSFNTTDTGWTWTCSGSTGTVSANCSANRIITSITPICGSANNTIATAAPTANLCAAGTASQLTGSGPWTWTCSGSIGTSPINCSANKTVPNYIYPACGSVNSTTANSIPASDLCRSGTASTPIVTSTGWTWTCSGSIGTSPINCSVKKITSPAVAPIECKYDYSDWSVCSNGKQSRTIKSKTPENCSFGEALLERSCEPEVPACVKDNWQCDDSWGPCTSVGKQYRICKLVFDCPTVTTAEPQTERACTYETSVAVNPIVLPAAEPTVTASSQPTAVVEQVPPECVKAGYYDKGDCEIYQYQSKVVGECLAKNLTTQEQCRQYFLSTYGKPIKCQNSSEAECAIIINKLILSDLADVIAPETKQALTESSGHTATIDAQSQTLNVNIENSTQPQQSIQIKVQDLPLAPSAVPVPVSLLAIDTASQQQTLSPVAIIFDSNRNGISDDAEARLGNPESIKSIDPSTLSGVDKALIQGQSLEQPKFSSAAISRSIQVAAVSNVKTSDTTKAATIRFQGKAEPNQVITLFVYSAMPIVLTVKTDANGNWVYDLDKSLVDGKHEVYVAVNNDKGRIVESSLPMPFFIEKAQAVTMDQFAGIEDAANIPDRSSNMMMYYIGGVSVFVLFLILVFLTIRKKMTEE